MKKQTLKVLAVMLLSAMASLTAFAQATHPTIPKVKMEAGPGNGASLETDSELSLQSLSVGWNYVHPKNCALYYSGGLPYLFVYTNEGPYFWTTSTVFQQLLDPACQTGNWVAFYVFNGNGNWDEIYTYTYR